MNNEEIDKIAEHIFDIPTITRQYTCTLRATSPKELTIKVNTFMKGIQQILQYIRESEVDKLKEYLPKVYLSTKHLSETVISIMVIADWVDDFYIEILNRLYIKCSEFEMMQNLTKFQLEKEQQKH